MLVKLGLVMLAGPLPFAISLHAARLGGHDGHAEVSCLSIRSDPFIPLSLLGPQCIVHQLGGGG